MIFLHLLQNKALNEGAAKTIDSGELQADDQDTNNDNLIYPITAAPANGQLELTTSAGAISSFTPKQLNADQAVYIHNDGTTSDSFIFNVQDGSGNDLKELTFSITIEAVDDTPAITVNS